MERIDELRTRFWMLPIPTAVLASLLVVGGVLDYQILMAAGIAMACASLATPVRRHLREDVQERRPAGVLVIGIGQLLLMATTFISGATLGVFLILSAATCAVGSVAVVEKRLGARPAIIERELLILSAGLGLNFFVVALDNSTSSSAVLFSVISTSTAGSIGIFGLMLLLWLSNHDSGVSSTPLKMLLGAQFVNIFYLVTQAFDAASIVDSEASQTLPAIASAAIVASVLHPNNAAVFAPAVVGTSGLDAKRSIITTMTVTSAPVLLVLNEIFSLGLSLPVLIVGSSMLSLLLALHLQAVVTELVKVEHQGQHDPLTGLPNRPLLFSRLEMAIESSATRESKFATMFLDLDRFKAVNDTLGHDAGDELLRQVAVRLRTTAERLDSDVTVARLGGDEFALLVPNIRDDRHARAIGRLFLDQFLEPFDLGLRDIYVTPSIGVSQFPRDGKSVEKLIENADTAMFEAKERGRNTFVTYSPEQRIPGADRLEIESALHTALSNEELQLKYQPQIDIQTGRIFAVEALLRWEHPTLGEISPERFIHVAEESSLIDTIGLWSLNQACAEAASWGAWGLPEINIAVNLSPRQFQKALHLTSNVANALRMSGLQPGRLELELTESLALEKPDEVNATLTDFRNMGIRTAIDDFGVGHTGLDYLDRISVDTLKIDRSFINRIGESGAPLVTAVISLAKGLDLDVIAEGVESEAQVRFLKNHGCRYMQGYLFSKPLSAPQLRLVLERQQEMLERSVA